MKKTIKDFNLKNKRVIIRCDLNVPMKDGIIEDDTRIKESVETILYAVKKKAKVIILSHLGRIKEENEYDPIVVLDNSKTHHADITIKKAKQLDITLVFLPPYSPDLNPIEFIWKSVRKEILKEFIESVTQLRDLIKNEYMKLAKSKSFANNWMKIFDEQIKSVMNS